jgi:hypothetical protein
MVANLVVHWVVWTVGRMVATWAKWKVDLTVVPMDATMAARSVESSVVLMVQQTAA